jgi:two-component system cell cycle response regulator
MRAALSAPFDIVVTDAIMPYLSGYELCRFLRSSPQLTHLPIVLLSALERKEEHGEAPAVDAFLAKPVSPEELIACIERLVPRR